MHFPPGSGRSLLPEAPARSRRNRPSPSTRKASSRGRGRDREGVSRLFQYLWGGTGAGGGSGGQRGDKVRIEPLARNRPLFSAGQRAGGDSAVCGIQDEESAAPVWWDVGRTDQTKQGLPFCGIRSAH